MKKIAVFDICIFFLCCAVTCCVTSCYATQQISKNDLSNFLEHARASGIYWAGDTVGAQHAFEQLTVDCPNDVRAVCGLADCFYTQNNFQQAQSYYQQVLKNVTESVDTEKLLFNIGCAQAQKKEFKESLESFEQVVLINKENTRAQKNIEILKKLLEQEKQQQKNNNSKDENKNDKQQKQDNSKNGKSEGKCEPQDNSKQNSKDQKERDNKQQKQPGSGQERQQPQQSADNGKPEQNKQSAGQPENQRGKNAQNTQKTDVKQLDKQSAALLRDIDKFDQQGQHMYLQALAGQSAEQKRSAHDW